MSTNPYESPRVHEPAEKTPPNSTNIDASELFGVVSRGIGLYWISIAAYNLMGAIYSSPGFTNRDFSLRMGVMELLAGVIPFFFPELLVKIAYRNKDKQISD